MLVCSNLGLRHITKWTLGVSSHIGVNSYCNMIMIVENRSNFMEKLEISCAASKGWEGSDKDTSKIC